ncbi:MULTISPECIES: STAS/SEC14 domain-containing protein [Shewanella]|uniref:STAS/SEC14 domain-containing protein n=1 Tax=Shewanella nanhaiensis TaxID=2864872 RepID=A0ABS7E2Q0_9GAMM|nr:STAS/SEC14 domain-containing protein [Shewanella nanhaiensis]MBW8183902.1 STAS/SEC14 domain-containing protein [Shewanella nanhaiensis]
MLELLNGFDHDTVAIRATGVVTGKDYDQQLMPVIEDKLKDHASIKLWYEFDDKFEGVTVGTLWDDAKIGLFHLNDFYRVAIITDSQLVAGMANTLAYMIPCPVKVFARSEASEATHWMKES